jgi:hypothetical protein
MVIEIPAAWHAQWEYNDLALHRAEKRQSVSCTSRLSVREWYAANCQLQGAQIVPAHAQAVEDDLGVADGLKEFIGETPQAAHMFGVNLDANGQPQLESLQQAASKRVIVRTSLR